MYKRQVIDRVERLRWLVFDWSNGSTLINSRHVGFAALAVAGVALGLWRRRFGPAERVAAVWLGLLLVAFLSAAAYWDQYNAALAPSAALLAGFACSPLPAWFRRREPVAAAIVVAASLALILALVLGLRTSWMESRTAGGEASLVATEIREHVPDDECVLSFEPGWVLGAGRLPDTDGTFPPVDPYAAELMRADDALAQPAATTDAAFRDQPLPASSADELGRCRFVALGARGRAQLNPAQLGWFTSHFTPVTDTSELWVRTS